MRRGVACGTLDFPASQRPRMTLLDDFRRHLPTLSLPAGRALVAVSGGPDSVALLDLLHRTVDLHQLELVVAHFDHGIHPASARVAAGVRALAGSYRLPYEEGRGELGPEMARTRRAPVAFVVECK